MLPADILYNVRVEIVSSNADGLIAYYSGKCNDGNLRRTSTDINNHVAHRFFNVDSNSDCSRHRLVDKINFFSAGDFRRVAYSTFLHLRNSGRNTTAHPQERKKPGLPVVNHFTLPTNQGLAGVESAITPFANRRNGFYLMGAFPFHLL